jgi:hypothetical protein
MKLINESPQADMSAKAIMARIRTLQQTAPNEPKGTPKGGVNRNETNPLYPVEHNGPADRRWNPGTMITGSGNGPEFGTSSSAA